VDAVNIAAKRFVEISEQQHLMAVRETGLKRKCDVPSKGRARIGIRIISLNKKALLLGGRCYAAKLHVFCYYLECRV
jgi:hypothetical protein